MRCILALALGLTLNAGISSAHAAGKHDGLYAGQCSRPVQCSIVIEGNKFTWVAADWFDANKILCEVSGRLKHVRGNAYGSKYQGRDIRVDFGNGGEIMISGTSNKPCGMNLQVNGTYYTIGD